MRGAHQPHGIVYLRKEYLDELEKLIDGDKVKNIDAALELAILRKALGE
jgi:hypothetical protein